MNVRSFLSIIFCIWRPDMPSSITPIKTPHHSVIVVGGGQAGLSASYYLQQQGVDHLVLEKHSLTHAWRNQRWDAFSLVTPNWQCALPGYRYSEEHGGSDPHGFMKKDEINACLAGFVKAVNAALCAFLSRQRRGRLAGRDGLLPDRRRHPSAARGRARQH